jgi:hypothetical protein
MEERVAMKFVIFVLPTVPGTLEDRRNLPPIGRNNERYQQIPAKGGDHRRAKESKDAA